MYQLRYRRILFHYDKICSGHAGYDVRDRAEDITEIRCLILWGILRRMYGRKTGIMLV
ncbi:MAG: hypothetical protein J6C84_08235 [Lachnospiraceae bacterium]|nr:hypothetical protein [Lachnospiraceae bacterium]